MHVTLTRVSTGDQPLSNATIVGEEMHRWLRDLEGFLGLLVRRARGIGARADLLGEQRDRGALSHVRGTSSGKRMIGVAGVEIEEVVDYELMFAELAALSYPA